MKIKKISMWIVLSYLGTQAAYGGNGADSNETQEEAIPQRLFLSLDAPALEKIVHKLDAKSLNNLRLVSKECRDIAGQMILVLPHNTLSWKGCQKATQLFPNATGLSCSMTAEEWSQFEKDTLLQLTQGLVPDKHSLATFKQITHLEIRGGEDNVQDKRYPIFFSKTILKCDETQESPIEFEVKEFAEAFANLRKIRISSVHTAHFLDFSAVQGRIEKIELDDLWYLQSITGLEHCPKLQKVIVSWSDNVESAINLGYLKWRCGIQKLESIPKLELHIRLRDRLQVEEFEDWICENTEIARKVTELWFYGSHTITAYTPSFPFTELHRLNNLSSLLKLRLNGKYFSYADDAFLVPSTVKWLSLSGFEYGFGTRAGGDSGFCSILPENLEHLEVMFSQMTELPPLPTTLRTLKLESCDKLTSFGDLSSCTRLHEIHLSDLPKITSLEPLAAFKDKITIEEKDSVLTQLLKDL